MERRISHRMHTRREVVGRVPATPITATVLNISTTGCMARANGLPVKTGATIVLDLSDADEVAGQVVWHEGQKFGVEFHQPINADTVARLTDIGVEHFGEDAELKDRFGRRLPELGNQVRFRLG